MKIKLPFLHAGLQRSLGLQRFSSQVLFPQRLGKGGW